MTAVSFIAPLWGSLISQSSGASQYWYWDRMRQPAFAQQLRSRGTLSQPLEDARPGWLAAGGDPGGVRGRGPLEIIPGGEWGKSSRTEFTVQPSGEVPGIAEMPRYLHGTGHADLFRGCTFRVSYAGPGKFAIKVAQIAGRAHALVITLDGKPAATREFPAANRDQSVNAAVEIDVPQGEHLLGLSNTGSDWVVLRGFRLIPICPPWESLARRMTAMRRFGSSIDVRTCSPRVKKATVRCRNEAGQVSRGLVRHTKGRGHGVGDGQRRPSGGVLEISTPAIAQDRAVWVSP